VILTQSIAIGLLVGFIFYELTGLSAGGFVVPGYIALYWDRPLMVLATIIISFFTYCFVSALSRVATVYGRRRFILMIMVGFSFQWLFSLTLIKTHFMVYEMDVIGMIIPGLIANEMSRQRIIPTIASLCIVSIFVRLVLISTGLMKSY
jgi:poly-gamma-glutamate biosynthesis protein PgsC/CapC